MEFTKEIYNMIHNSGKKFSLSMAGGGFEVVGEISKFGGSSASLIDVYINQSMEKTQEFLGYKPEKFVGLDITKKLANKTYLNALSVKKYNPDINLNNIFAVSSNCTLRKVPEERDGRLHSMHVVIQTNEMTITHSLEYTNSNEIFRGLSGEEIRRREEKIVSNMVINGILKGCGLDLEITLDNNVPHLNNYVVKNESSLHKINQQNVVSDFITNQSPVMFFKLGGEKIESSNSIQHEIKSIYPGSFNPIHDGHIEVINKYEEEHGNRPVIELSFTNVDKPSIDLLELEKRLKYMHENLEKETYVAVTKHPMLRDKINLFGSCDYIVGYDTAERLYNLKYYKDHDDMNTFFDFIIEKEIGLVIASRMFGEQLKTAEDLQLPTKILHRTKSLNVLSSMSSSEIRANGGF